MNNILSESNIHIDQSFASKDEAIQFAGQVLVDNGYVETSYVDEMYQREASVSTFMGNGVAIPHGTDEAKDFVKESGLSIVTVPKGVDWGGQTAHLIIGIAGKGNEHLEILQKIALVVADQDQVNKIVNAASKEDVLSLFDLGED
ncbi:PTS sugar transporter subunit IIA [Tuberibacillus sp. Marseille-P3662]|uniref:PTS sugar transporter subunit IIA n=1 Tax=Tuberibacillus sp. Marseille-P3662 TaxID=1965358 RepID=UPI000A1CC7EB|nr:PTS sugar transporter subunit IIA [Tuberibacillus sp. Marseille-P3662]